MQTAQLRQDSCSEHIEITEPGRAEVPRECFAHLGDQKFMQVREVLAPLVSITGDWKGEKLIFIPNTRVGAIEVNGIRVVVRPRLAAAEFLNLIRYTSTGKVLPRLRSSTADLATSSGLEDILCLLLANEVDRVFNLGLSRRYVETVEPLQVLRGRPLWERNFPWRGAKAKEIVCRWHKLTYDNLDNRILLAGLRCAGMLSTKPEVKSLVLRCLKSLHDLASPMTCEPRHFEEAQQAYNRLNEHYRCAHAVCRMLLFGLRPKSLFDAGPTVVSGFTLDMAQLFEDFLYQLVSDLLEPAAYTVRAQPRDRSSLQDGTGATYAEVRPDLEIWKGDAFCGIIDAKYKEYWALEATGSKPLRKVSNEDLYQLFFYQQRLRTKHRLARLPVAIIACPLPAEDERNGAQELPDRFKRICWQSAMERGGEVHLLPIPLTQFLRLLVSFR